jgi:hypothetical protein
MRKLLVVLVLLGLAAVAADRVAHKVAADEAEQRLAAEGLEEPAVTVRGFPFLTQLAAREFDDVDVTARLVRTGNGRARRVEAHGHDVRVPSGGDVVVGRLEATGTVPYAEVERRLGRPGLSLSAAGDGQVRLRSDVPVPGGTLAVTARARCGCGEPGCGWCRPGCGCRAAGRSPDRCRRCCVTACRCGSRSPGCRTESGSSG